MLDCGVGNTKNLYDPILIPEAEIRFQIRDHILQLNRCLGGMMIDPASEGFELEYGVGYIIEYWIEPRL